MNPYIGGAITIIVAVAGPWLGYQLAKRKASGKIETTEAESLWTAQTGFRDTVLAEAERLREQVAKLQQDVMKSFEDVLELRLALSDAKQENGEVRADSHRLRNMIMRFEFEASQLRKALADANSKLIGAGLPPVEVEEPHADA